MTLQYIATRLKQQKSQYKKAAGQLNKGKHALIRKVLAKSPLTKGEVSSWVIVHNFFF